MTTLNPTSTNVAVGRTTTISLDLFPFGLYDPPPLLHRMLVAYAEVLGQIGLTYAQSDHCKDSGRHLTPTCSLLGGN